MGTLGLRFQGTQNLAQNTDFCQAEDPQCLCQGISVTHKIWERKPDFFWLKFLHFWRSKKPANGLYKVTSGHWERKWQGAVTALGLWLHENDIFQEVSTSLHHCWWSPPQQAAQGYWMTRGGDTNHRAGWAIWNEIFSHPYLWFLILGKTRVWHHQERLSMPGDFHMKCLW